MIQIKFIFNSYELLLFFRSYLLNTNKEINDQK